MELSDPRLTKRARVECPTCRQSFRDAAQLGRHTARYRDSCAVFQPDTAEHQPRLRRVAPAGVTSSQMVAPSTEAASVPAQAAADPGEQSSDVSDVDMHLMVLTETANGGLGMLDADVTELLELFNRIRSTGVFPSITSVPAYKAALKALGGTPWQERDDVTSTDTPR